MSIKVAQLAKIFKALSDQNRLAIVLSLKDGEKSGTEILKNTAPFSQPTLSHHLAILCESEVLNARRNGKTVVYSINTETAETISEVAATLSQSVGIPQILPGISVKVAPSPKKAAAKPPKEKTAPAPKKAAAPAEPAPEPETKPAPRRRNDDFDFFD